MAVFLVIFSRATFDAVGDIAGVVGMDGVAVVNLGVVMRFVISVVARRDIGVVHGILTGNTAGVRVNGFVVFGFVVFGFVVDGSVVQGFIEHSFFVRGFHGFLVHGRRGGRLFMHGGGCRGPVRRSGSLDRRRPHGIISGVLSVAGVAAGTVPGAGRGRRNILAGLESLRRDNVLALGPLDLLLGPELFTGQRSAGAAENFTGGVVTVDRAHCSLPF